MNLKKPKKIGILGGAFNPPHLGHLILAKRALKAVRLQKIIFMPCGIPPLRKSNLAETKDRLAMVKILIKDNPLFKISDYEIKKGEKGKKSYTYETIKYLKKKYPDYQIYWILGEDSFREMIEGKWKYDGLKMLAEAHFLVADRKKHPFNLKTLPKKFKEKSKKFLKKVIRLNLNVPVSATQIRKEIKKGKKRNKFLPPQIFAYIKRKKLYTKTR